MKADDPPAHQHLGLSEYLPKALAAFLGQHPTSASMSRSAKAPRSHKPSSTGPPTSALRPSIALPDSIERIVSETGWCWLAARGTSLQNGGMSIFATSSAATRRPDDASALHAHIADTRRGSARAAPSGRAQQFSIRSARWLAAGIGIAVMPEVAANAARVPMRISMVRIRDPWDRKLAICARSFRALPKPAQQLVEHLRKAAARAGVALSSQLVIDVLTDIGRKRL